MYTLEYYDNQVPEDIHAEAYNYIQQLDWESRFRHIPNPSSNYKDDLTPYVAKKTIYRVPFGHDYRSMHMHTPIGILFDHINNTMFDGKFELAGKPLGETPSTEITDKEKEDYAFDRSHQGCIAYMQAQPYETIKRTRLPHRDWDSTPLDDSNYYTLVFVANLCWSPLWHSEMFFYNDKTQDDIVNPNVKQTRETAIGWGSRFVTNMPGRVVLYDSRLLHSARPTSTMAPELAQRIGFRVKLKEGQTHVQY